MMTDEPQHEAAFSDNPWTHLGTLFFTRAKTQNKQQQQQKQQLYNEKHKNKFPLTKTPHLTSANTLK